MVPSADLDTVLKREVCAISVDANLELSVGDNVGKREEDVLAMVDVSAVLSTVGLLERREVGTSVLSVEGLEDASSCNCALSVSAEGPVKC